MIGNASSPYVEKNFDLDFSTTRTPYYLGPAYPGQTTPNWFSSSVFGVSGADLPAWFSSSIDAPAGASQLPPWFFAGVVAVIGGVVFFTIRSKKKGRR